MCIRDRGVAWDHAVAREDSQGLARDECGSARVGLVVARHPHDEILVRLKGTSRRRELDFVSDVDSIEFAPKDLHDSGAPFAGGRDEDGRASGTLARQLANARRWRVGTVGGLDERSLFCGEPRSLEPRDDPRILGDGRDEREVRPIANFERERALPGDCLLYTSPSPRDRTRSRMPSSA